MLVLLFLDAPQDEVTDTERSSADPSLVVLSEGLLIFSRSQDGYVASLVKLVNGVLLRLHRLTFVVVGNSG